MGMQVNVRVLYPKLKGSCGFICQVPATGRIWDPWAAKGQAVSELRCGRDPRYVCTGAHMCMCLSHY